MTEVEKESENVPSQPDKCSAPLSAICPRCGGTLRPALRPVVKSRLVLVGEALFTAAAILGIVYKSSPSRSPRSCPP